MIAADGVTTLALLRWTNVRLSCTRLRILEKEGLVKVIQQQSELMEEMLKVQTEQAASYSTSTDTSNI